MSGLQEFLEQYAVSFQTGLRRKFIRNGKRDMPPVDHQIIAAFRKDRLRGGTDGKTGHILFERTRPADTIRTAVDAAIARNGEENCHIVLRAVGRFDIIADIGQRTRHDVKPVRQCRSQERQPEPDTPFGK